MGRRTDDGADAATLAALTSAPAIPPPPAPIDAETAHASQNSLKTAVNQCQNPVDIGLRRLYTSHRFGFQSSIRNVTHQRLP